jgi:hypothetical protein
MEYSHLLDLADECEDPYMRLVYSGMISLSLSLSHSLTLSMHLWYEADDVVIAASFFISVYNAFQRTWKPFNPILGETYELTNHGDLTFISEQVRYM